VGTYLAARLLTAAVVKAPVAVMVAAAAAAEGDSYVRSAVITGVFGVLVALIGAAALLFRHRSPDLSELLDVHERLAVIETNMADMRDDLRAIARRLDR
jgi:membrane associated rhomboid family serine protease